MNKTSINTFVKGMAKDIDKSVLSPDSYLDAYNFRVVTSEGASSGAFENILGNKLVLGGEDLPLLPPEQLVVGYTRVRDIIVLFTTDNTEIPVHGTGRSMIHTFTVNTITEEIQNLTLVYDDNLNAGLGDDTLDFSLLYPITAIGRYENENTIKVYFTDGYNNLRYIDIGKSLTITGEPYILNDYMNTVMFELLPLLTPSLPTVNKIVSGHLYSGMVQYAYQLYRLNGAATAFSPVSSLFHIVSDSDFSSTTLNYKGDPESLETSKGLEISIVNGNTGYDRLRLVRMHYSTLNSIPIITIVSEVKINTTPSTVYITDIGDQGINLTLDEFNISSTELFKCEDIASKDNRLFAAGIESSDFINDSTIDEFDVRAVRFRALDSTAYVFDNEGGQRVIDSTLSNWNNPTTGYPIDHDGINRFNDHENDVNSNYGFMYQSDGVTRGAEGPNVLIDFETDSMILDNSNSTTTFSTTSTNYSYTNYASPWAESAKSWQRDETYRLFAVWMNERGQRYAPKWIIDLRMPSIHDGTFDNSDADTVNAGQLTDFELVSGKVYAHPLRPRILFKSKPAGAVSCQIYRVKRERGDRSIITQGIAIPVKKGSNNVYYPDQVDRVIPDTDYQLIKMVSPEINITKNISSTDNGYLEYVSSYDVYEETGDTYHPTAHRRISKLTEYSAIPFSTDIRTDIVDMLEVSPASADNVSNHIILDNKPFCNYNVDGEHTYSKGCTGLLISYDNTDWEAEGNKYCLVNYKNNVFNSQYGGPTYENRSLNIGIPCSDIITNTDQWYSILGGDTYINYFDVSTMLVDLVNTGAHSSVGESLFVPVESSINCDLRHDTSSSHATSTIPPSIMRQEYAGEHKMIIDEITFTYNQELDLYLYNTVYSQETSVQNTISEGIDTPTNSKFDCLVKASNIKYNGENSDSWTKFNINEEIDVDANYGAIRAIDTVNDKLLFWQEDAFGILAVNDRSLIQDGSSAQLALGTGGVLDRYDYISSTVGIVGKQSIVKSDSSVYWFYDKDTSLYRFNNQLSNLSKEKSMWSWFKDVYGTVGPVHGVYDRKYNEVLYTFTETATVGFSEQTDQFEPLRSFYPRMYIDYKEGYLSVVDNDDATNIYLHNSTQVSRCYFYGQSFESTIKLMINNDYPYTKVFDNVYYISTALDEDTDVEQYGITFDKMRCYNDYQNTDWVDLTYPTNIMRRDRGWTATVPRNLVNADYTTSPDIFSNLDTTKVWKERIRDKYMILDLSFDNTHDTKFVVPFIGVKYRLSYR